MKMLFLLCAMIASQMSHAMMTDEQFDRMNEAYLKRIESQKLSDYKRVMCLNAKLLDVMNSKVKEIRVFTFRERGIVENIFGNIFGDDVSNWRVNFSIILENDVANLNCGIWTKGKNTDLVNHCTYSNDGRKFDISKYHRSIISKLDWFVIDKGCLED